MILYRLKLAQTVVSLKMYVISFDRSINESRWKTKQSKDHFDCIWKSGALLESHHHPPKKLIICFQTIGKQNVIFAKNFDTFTRHMQAFLDRKKISIAHLICAKAKKSNTPPHGMWSDQCYSWCLPKTLPTTWNMAYVLRLPYVC